MEAPATPPAARRAALVLPAAALLFGACVGPTGSTGLAEPTDSHPATAEDAGAGAEFEVRSWGTMREALRERRSHARAVPVEVVGPTSIGVGALADLVGEVTIVDGAVLVADGVGPAAGATRPGTADDGATLLVVADVPAWEGFDLPACADLAELEAAIEALLVERGADLDAPTPVRVAGRADGVELHVIAGDCPVAHPEGTPPLRRTVRGQDVELVGVFVKNAAGRLTHHTGVTHLHAVAGEGAARISGHVDEVALRAGARVLLPVQ